MQLVGVEVAVDALLASRGVVGEERSDAVSASFNISSASTLLIINSWITLDPRFIFRPMANSASASSCADEYSFVLSSSVTNSPPLSQSSTSTEVVPAGSRYRLDMIIFFVFEVLFLL